MEDIQMIGKRLLIAMTIFVAVLISSSAYAGGGRGGGQGHGMMGSGGNGMMGFGQNFSSPWTSQPRKFPTDQNKQQERERLKKEIRAKRQVLSELYRADKPDKVLIDQKIAELYALEAEYDRSFSGAR